MCSPWRLRREILTDERRKILGFPKWLAYHKMLQILGSMFLAVGTPAIFALKDADGKHFSGPAIGHMIFGIFILIMSIGQPLVAIFRPTPHAFIEKF